MTFVTLWVLASMAIYAVLVASSIEGYEDEHGFHRGRPR